MSLFSSLPFGEAKDKLLAKLESFNYEIKDQNLNYISVKIPFADKERYLTITLTSVKKGKVIVDIYDSFYILHIPRREFKKSSDFCEFIDDFKSTMI